MLPHRLRISKLWVEDQESLSQVVVQTIKQRMVGATCLSMKEIAVLINQSQVNSIFGHDLELEASKTDAVVNLTRHL